MYEFSCATMPLLGAPTPPTVGCSTVHDGCDDAYPWVHCYVTPKRYAPVAAQRELLLASCTTEHHVHLGGGGGYRPQRVGFTLFGLSSGRRAVLAMRLYLLTMCPSPNSARLSCAQRNAPPHPPHYWYHRECSVVLAVLCSRLVE